MSSKANPPSSDPVSSASMIATHEIVTNLIHSKTAMESLVHEMHDLTALITLEGRVVWGNTTCAEWLSIPHDRLHENSLRPLFDGKAWETYASEIHELQVSRSQERSFQGQIQRNAQTRDILWTLRPFHAISERRGLILLAVGRDITEVLAERSERSKMEAELETAQIMQRAFFPPESLDSPYLSIRSFYRPADQCSGDWWGYFDLGNGRELVCIADVTGHGAASALVTAMTQASCLSFSKRHFESSSVTSPASLINEINEVVYRTFRGDIYMTFFVFVFDHKEGKARIANAAHNFPLRLKAQRDAQKPTDSLIVQGNPVGHALDSVYAELEIDVRSGDRLILYTDGLTECRNPQSKMYGSGAFRRSIIRHEKLDVEAFRNAIIKDALDFFAGQKLADDLTLAVVEIR